MFQCGTGSTETKLYLGPSVKADSITASSRKVAGTRIKLFAPYNISGDAFKHVLKGGDYVRVYHREANGFLCARISNEATHAHDPTATHAEPPGHALVALRLLPPTLDRDKYHDVTSLWQVELPATDRRGGRAILWRDNIRLKNLVSGEFLSVAADGSLVLSAAPAALATPAGVAAQGTAQGGEPLRLVELSLSNQDGASELGVQEPIPFTSFFYIRRATESAQPWVHARPGDTSKVTNISRQALNSVGGRAYGGGVHQFDVRAHKGA